MSGCVYVQYLDVTNVRNSIDYVLKNECLNRECFHHVSTFEVIAEMNIRNELIINRKGSRIDFL